MSSYYDGKVVVVTGAASGIGAALDVRDAAAFTALVTDVITRHGTVDMLFNNARGVRVSALCPGAIDTPMLDRRGPEDLPTPAMELEPRRFLRRLLGREQPVDAFVANALAGVARNKALIIEPARARMVARLLRLAPGAGGRVILRAVRAERQAAAGG
jgi:NAD(P)-dependent dehydrogenase (short-subunit alcohol dehydrogenase family)